MKTQTIFQAGNSPFAVTIPTDLAREVKFKKGQQVVWEKMDDDSLIIKKASTSKIPTKTDRELESWLKKTFEEDGEILDELAVR